MSAPVKVTRMIEGFFGGLKFLVLGFFCVGKFGRYILASIYFNLSGNISMGFIGYSKQSEDSW